jgi:hypothetical protein
MSLPTENTPTFPDITIPWDIARSLLASQRIICHHLSAKCKAKRKNSPDQKEYHEAFVIADETLSHLSDRMDGMIDMDILKDKPLFAAAIKNFSKKNKSK